MDGGRLLYFTKKQRIKFVFISQVCNDVQNQNHYTADYKIVNFEKTGLILISNLNYWLFLQERSRNPPLLLVI